MRRSRALAFIVASLSSLSLLSQGAGLSIAQVFETSWGRFILTETAEGSRIAPMLARFERGEERALARELESRLNRIGDDIAHLSIAEEARMALLREAASQRLRIIQEAAGGEIRFLPERAARPTAREAFLNPALESAGTASLRGEMIPVLRVPRSWASAEGMVPYVRIAPGKAESVFLGVSELGDFSLIIRGGAKDLVYAGMIMNPPRVSATEMALAKPGLLMKLEGMPASSIAELKRLVQMRPQSVTVSCVNGACMKLRRAGVTLQGGDDLPIFRSQAIERILRHGFRGPNGEPVRATVILNTERSFENLFARFVSKDKANRRLVQMATRDIESEFANGGIANLGYQDPETKGLIVALVEKGVPTLVAIFAAGTVINESR